MSRPGCFVEYDDRNGNLATVAHLSTEPAWRTFFKVRWCD